MRHIAAAQNLSFNNFLLPGLQHGDLEIQHRTLRLAQQQPLAERIAFVVLFKYPDCFSTL